MVAKSELAHLAVPGRRIAVRVTPRAGRNDVMLPDPEAGDARLHVRVTSAPEGGKANAAVRKLLAKALGVAPGRVVLLHGASSRDKLFRID